jgi:putative ABC transport system permease protein
MRPLTKLSHRLRALFRRDRLNGELNAELEFHLEREVQEKVAAGMSPQEARRTTMIEFGALESIREECKDMRKINLISNLIRDIKFGARMLRKNPGFTAIALLTLALGIGANAAIFSLVRGVLLRPLVNRDENRLIYIRQSAGGLNVDNIAFSVPEVDDLRAGVKSVSEFGQFSQVEFTMLGLGDPRVVRAGVVDGEYFEVVGLHPVLGRLLDMRDDGPKAEGAVVLTYHFWTTVLKSDPSVIGKAVRLDGIFGMRPATVVGVLEPSIPYPADTEIIANIVTSPHHLSATMVTGRLHRMTELFGRLAPGATLDQARAELSGVYSTMEHDHPSDYPKQDGYGIDAKLLRTQITSKARTVLLVLLAASGLIFIIACSNVANLILARTVRREGELAIRAALGATSGALRRTLLAENLLLCGVGALLGVLLARPMVAVLARYASRFSVRALDLKVDSSMLWVGVGLALVAAVLLAFVPRLPASTNSQGTSSSGGSSRVAGGTSRRLRVFAIIQIAASFVLLAGAAMLVKTLLSLQSAQTGLDMHHVLTFNMPVTTYGKTPDEVIGFYRETLRRIQGIPGVDAVSIGNEIPWRDAGQFGSGLHFTADGQVHGTPEQDPRGHFRTITPGFFASLGVPILAGRDFNASDRRTSEPVVIISQTIADRMFPNRDAVDRHITLTDPVLKFLPGFNAAPTRIVGVSADVDDEHIVPGQIMTLYFPFEQVTFGGKLFVHTSGDPYALVKPITGVVRDMSTDQPLERAATLADVRAEVLTPDRLNTFVFGGFALVALTIAVVGVAGVLAFSVSARTREFGIRLAIGAQPRQLLAGVIVEGAIMAGAGIVAGAGFGYAMTRLATSYFADMHLPGAIVVVVSALLLMGAAVIAAALPAIRAARVDVIQALRAE